ncbi:AP-5 complex subunit sigma-1 [Phaenicophaeus curvirostris]|uniref:AP-5 complex subunit sigma-1 n=1 Tax=Phaenicophaeus curvirostris TaxID=33595 RepID=UPI0037F0C2C7
MARALVVLALCGPEPPGPGAPSCRLLYARTFGDPPGAGDPARQRLRRKEQLLALARQVASQCRLLQASSGRSPSPQLPPDEPISLQDAPGGVFQLRPGDPFPERLTVAWISVLSLAFALVCDPRENLPLAEITLRRLTPRFLASLRLLGSGTDVLLRPEVADRLLDRLLPHGRLLFLNECFLQALDREMGLKAAR